MKEVKEGIVWFREIRMIYSNTELYLKEKYFSSNNILLNANMYKGNDK